MTPDLIGGVVYGLCWIAILLFTLLDGGERLRQRTINRKGQRVRREL